MNRDQNTGNAQILIVDDDQTLLTLLAEYLEAAGYKTLTTSSGLAGLGAFDQYHPDFVILDVMMPGMDGWEVCERLRAKSAVPIILLTAKAGGDRQTARFPFRRGRLRDKAILFR